MLSDNAAPHSPPGNMPGFDPEFSDIVDYILRITLRIWEGKQVGLCHRYYSDDCPVWTLAGYTEGAEAVTQNTLMTLGSFPDRTLHADNIIWGGDAETGFHTSHRICTQMTHTGDNEFGPATGITATIAVIAHCICKDNRIVEEWLVRDNYSLALQLGADPESLASQWASQDLDPDSRFAEWLSSEWRRVRTVKRDAHGSLSDDNEERVRGWLQNIWNARLVGDTRAMYHDSAMLNASASEPRHGLRAVQQFYLDLLGALPDARISVDYTCSNSMQAGEHVAARWTLAGTHLGSNLWGPASGAPVLILGESHYRIENGRVAEEWLVYDELAVLTQIMRHRRQNGQLVEATLDV